MIDILTYKGIDYTISPDMDPLNPREDWDNLGKMVLFHHRYKLPNEIGISSDAYSNWSEMAADLIKRHGAVILIPISIYEHSGITIKIGSYGGQFGFIMATRKDILDNFQVKRLSKRLIEKTRAILECEVKTYDAYLTGEVYQYNINAPVFDSCGGYYGFSDVEEEVKRIIDFYLSPEQVEKRDAAQLDDIIEEITKKI